jgi:hypothetical protein
MGDHYEDLRELRKCTYVQGLDISRLIFAPLGDGKIGSGLSWYYDLHHRHDYMDIKILNEKREQTGN